MKKIILLIIFIPILVIIKNFILYFTYYPNEIILVREGQITKNLKGNWIGEYYDFPHMDERKICLNYNFSNDSIGRFSYKIFSKKIDGKRSRSFSWHALLPFGDPEVYEGKVKIIDSEYLMHIPGARSLWTDIVYTKFYTNYDTLYLDKYYLKSKYTKKPDWNSNDKLKPKLYEMLYFWFL